MVFQINVQLISQLAANSSLWLLLPFLFHFFLLLRNVISHQVDGGRRNEMEIHPFISILVTLKSLDREMKRLQCSHQMYLMIIRDISSVQFSSVTQSCPTLCDPMNRSTPGLSVHHHPLASWKPSCLPHHYCGRGWACVLDARLLQGETEVRLSPQPRAHRSPAIWNPRRTWATRSDGPRKPGAAAWKVWLATRRRTS